MFPIMCLCVKVVLGNNWFIDTFDFSTLKGFTVVVVVPLAFLFEVDLIPSTVRTGRKEV